MGRYRECVLVPDHVIVDVDVDGFAELRGEVFMVRDVSEWDGVGRPVVARVDSETAAAVDGETAAAADPWTVSVPVHVWMQLGDLIGDSGDVICSVSVSVGSSLVDVVVRVDGFGLSDGVPMVSGRVLDGDAVSVPAASCFDWVWS